MEEKGGAFGRKFYAVADKKIPIFANFVICSKVEFSIGFSIGVYSFPKLPMGNYADNMGNPMKSRLFFGDFIFGYGKLPEFFCQ